MLLPAKSATTSTIVSFSGATEFITSPNACLMVSEEDAVPHERVIAQF